MPVGAAKAPHLEYLFFLDFGHGQFSCLLPEKRTLG